MDRNARNVFQQRQRPVGRRMRATEVGGLVSDLSDDQNYLKTGNIIAGTPKVFSQLLQVIDGYRTPAL